ncbi:MAG: hypothetical protein LBL13_04680 [Bacteroidales bacterium]|jgi:hypothetical protein|nr:hypothetical protein [Bacteroidales bacterium]
MIRKKYKEVDMLITLGRNVPGGKYAAAMEMGWNGERENVYISLYEQNDGFSTFSQKDLIAKILIDRDYLLGLIEHYDRLTG